jgi:hypothetical protein
MINRNALIKSLVSVLFAGACFTTPSQAESIDKPCREDAKKFCSGLTGGTLALNRCLRENIERLSLPCVAHRRGVPVFRIACSKELKEHCSAVPGGWERRVECLKRIQGKLSQDCRDALDSRKKTSVSKEFEQSFQVERAN